MDFNPELGKNEVLHKLNRMASRSYFQDVFKKKTKTQKPFLEMLPELGKIFSDTLKSLHATEKLPFLEFSKEVTHEWIQNACDVHCSELLNSAVDIDGMILDLKWSNSNPNPISLLNQYVRFHCV